MSNELDWTTGLDAATDTRLAANIPLRLIAEQIGVCTSSLSQRLRARGINIPLGRKPSPRPAPGPCKQDMLSLRSAWAAPHFEDRVSKITTALSGYIARHHEREMRA